MKLYLKRVLKKSRTLKMNNFIFKKITIYSYTASPTPLIPLPSVSFQILSLRASQRRTPQGRGNLLTGYKRLLRRAKNALLAMTKGE
jgi:hypothetical protein